MYALTIRNIDSATYNAIKKKSKQEKLSMNQLILEILHKAFLGSKSSTRYHDLDPLFGKWSNEEYKEFNKTQKSVNKIDFDLWK